MKIMRMNFGSMVLPLAALFCLAFVSCGRASSEKEDVVECADTVSVASFMGFSADSLDVTEGKVKN